MTSSKSITFAQFEQVLTGLGFRRKAVPEKGIAYVHAATDTIILVRAHKPSEPVPWHILASSRVQLDGRGVIAAADFDEMLKAAAA